MTISTTENLIRQPETTDVEDIVQINRKCLPENYAPAFFHRMLSENRQISCVAIQGEKIVGYLMSRRDHRHTLRGNKVRCHIMSVAVLHEYRKQGIGGMMLKYIIDQCGKNLIHEIVLEVRESNESAIRLYRTYGFEKEKTLQRYYLDGEDGVLMRKKIAKKRNEKKG